MTALVAALESAIWDREGRRVGHEIQFRCPIEGHLDVHPSARWNPEKQGWFCHVCATGGGWKDLAMRLGLLVHRDTVQRRSRPCLKPNLRPADWRRQSAMLLCHADGLDLRAGRVLDMATRLTLDDLTDEEMDAALGAVAKAYHDQEKSERLRDLGFRIRWRGWQREQEVA